MLQVLLMFLMTPLTYEEAYELSLTSNNLIILISKENCPPCIVQEYSLKEAKIIYHKTYDASRWLNLPTLRPLTIWYWREGKEWKKEILKGSIDLDRLRYLKQQRNPTPE
jgi:hypothetical protein